MYSDAHINSRFQEIINTDDILKINFENNEVYLFSNSQRRMILNKLLKLIKECKYNLYDLSLYNVLELLHNEREIYYFISSCYRKEYLCFGILVYCRDIISPYHLPKYKPKWEKLIRRILRYWHRKRISLFDEYPEYEKKYLSIIFPLSKAKDNNNNIKYILEILNHLISNPKKIDIDKIIQYCQENKYISHFLSKDFLSRNEKKLYNNELFNKIIDDDYNISEMFQSLYIVEKKIKEKKDFNFPIKKILDINFYSELEVIHRLYINNIKIVEIEQNIYKEKNIDLSIKYGNMLAYIEITTCEGNSIYDLGGLGSINGDESRKQIIDTINSKIAKQIRFIDDNNPVILIIRITDRNITIEDMIQIFYGTELFYFDVSKPSEVKSFYKKNGLYNKMFPQLDMILCYREISRDNCGASCIYPPFSEKKNQMFNSISKAMLDKIIDVKSPEH
ncbi:MAG TPA: hypothetical protein PK718_04160 [Candidatus Methanofastidiosa archaeon]|nr:hypothetical protein [Candidatus Methanofastidiosa archaeon]